MHNQYLMGWKAQVWCMIYISKYSTARVLVMCIVNLWNCAVPFFFSCGFLFVCSRVLSSSLAIAAPAYVAAGVVGLLPSLMCYLFACSATARLLLLIKLMHIWTYCYLCGLSCMYVGNIYFAATSKQNIFVSIFFTKISVKFYWTSCRWHLESLHVKKINKDVWLVISLA